MSDIKISALVGVSLDVDSGSGLDDGEVNKGNKDCSADGEDER